MARISASMNQSGIRCAEPIPGPSTCDSALAAKHGVVLIASLFERRAAGLYHNTAVVFEAMVAARQISKNAYSR